MNEALLYARLQLRQTPSSGPKTRRRKTQASLVMVPSRLNINVYAGIVDRK
jgi:hypothetical protein